MEQGARTRLLTAVVLTVVFGSGVLLGLAAQANLAATPAAEVLAMSAGDPENTRRIPMYEQVGPTETQMGQIESIVAEHRAQMDALHEEFRKAYDPRYDALIAETREAIKDVLTPEQAAAYQELVDARDQRRAERSDGNDRD